MKKAPLLLVTLMAASVHADEPGDQQWKHRPITATYSIYSGEPGERAPPTPQDRKLAITVKGTAAKQIFDAIGPDSDVTCTAEKGERLRAKGEMWCAYRPKNGYRCYLGFDLRTGEPHAGTSC